MFLYKTEFEDSIFYMSENYNDIIDFIEKSNKKGHWRIYANQSSYSASSFYFLIHKFNSKDKKDKVEQDLPKRFTKDRTTVILEKNTNDQNTIVISIIINGKIIINNKEAHIGTIAGKEGVYLTVFVSKFIGPPDIIYIYTNDYPDLIKYLYKLGKNKELLKNYIKQ